MFKSDVKAEMIQFCFLPDGMDPANHPALLHGLGAQLEVLIKADLLLPTSWNWLGLLEICVCSFRLDLLLLSLLSRLLMLLHSPLQLIIEEFLPISPPSLVSHILSLSLISANKSRLVRHRSKELGID